MAAPQHKLETWRNRVGTERSQGLPHRGLPLTVLTGQLNMPCRHSSRSAMWWWPGFHRSCCISFERRSQVLASLAALVLPSSQAEVADVLV